MAVGKDEERIAVGLDRVERQVTLTAEREEGNDAADKDRGDHNLEPGPPRCRLKLRFRRVRHQWPRSLKIRLIQRFEVGVRPSFMRWSATRRLTIANVGYG